MAKFLTTLILAMWISGAAILSVQNATLVSLKFFTFQSIQMPVGVLLAFAAASGAIGTALLQAILPIVTRASD